MKNRISRRDFLKGSLAGAATAALSAGGLGVIAGAAETENMPSEAAENELYTYADTIKWDAEYGGNAETSQRREQGCGDRALRARGSAIRCP